MEKTHSTEINVLFFSSLASSGRCKASPIITFGGPGLDLQASQVPAFRAAALSPDPGAPLGPGPLSESVASIHSDGFLSLVCTCFIVVAQRALLGLLFYQSFVGFRFTILINKT